MFEERREWFISHRSDFIMRIANCCGQRSSILLMPTCRIFTNMHCRPIFYIFANADRLRAVLLSPALPPILPSWSMQMNDERNERINVVHDS